MDAVTWSVGDDRKEEDIRRARRAVEQPTRTRYRRSPGGSPPQSCGGEGPDRSADKGATGVSCPVVSWAWRAASGGDCLPKKQLR
jgi:hypothetical protein